MTPEAQRRRQRGRPASTHDNAPAAALLAGFLTPGEACRALPWLDHFFSGVLELRTEGDSATRSLRRGVLLLVLQRCRRISTQEVRRVLGGRYCPRAAERYAACARVVSKAIARHPDSAAATVSRTSDREARREVDAAWRLDADRAEALSLTNASAVRPSALTLRGLPAQGMQGEVPARALKRSALADLTEPGHV